MSRVLILTGTCGSGKSTIASLIANSGWLRISEDDLWKAKFGRDRGDFGSEAHRHKRSQVHSEVFEIVSAAMENHQPVVIDATVHESPPEAFLEYKTWLDTHGISWAIRVLHPSLEVSILRDSQRAGWNAGSKRVSDLYLKFTGEFFDHGTFLDTSHETPEETMHRVLAGFARQVPT